MHRIPFIDIAASFRAVRAEIDEAVAGVLDSAQFVLGPQLEAFERRLEATFGFAHAVGVANGTEALSLALRALNIGAGDTVAVPALTFFATAEAVIHAGATPIIIDVDDATSTMSPDALAGVAQQCSAVIPVHLYGHSADMAPILDIAAKHNLVVLEDAAQAIGARYREQNVGSFGDAAGFSFYPTKNLGGAGDGGAVVTNRADIAAHLRSLRHHGQSRQRDQHQEVGFNSRLDEIQAAILNVRLKHLDEYTKARREIASWYREALQGLPVEIPHEQEWAEAVYHLYVVRVDDRDRVREKLEADGIGTAVHYRIPLGRQPAVQRMGIALHPTPVADRIASRHLSLPMYPELSASGVEQVADALRKALS